MRSFHEREGGLLVKKHVRQRNGPGYAEILTARPDVSDLPAASASTMA